MIQPDLFEPATWGTPLPIGPRVKRPWKKPTYVIEVLKRARSVDPHVELTKKRRRLDPEAEKVCCVYKFTCVKNGKAYIGQTVQALERYFSKKKNHRARTGQRGRSGKPIRNGRLYPIARAIKKYGREGFRIEILCVGTVEYCRDVMEAKLIAAFGTQLPNGYNIGDGGEGFTSEDFKRWLKTPEGRAATARSSALAAEANERRAGYPTRRVLAELEKGPRSVESLATSLSLTGMQTCASFGTLRFNGHHIIGERGGIYRLVTLEEAADAWACGRALSNDDLVLGLLMEGPRTTVELAALLGVQFWSVRVIVNRLRKPQDFTVLGHKIKRQGRVIECRDSKYGPWGHPGIFHMIQDKHHPWAHLYAIDLRGDALDDRE